jgi:SOS-response transcriptional repressor LexA
MDIGARLKLAMDRRGVTQKEVAQTLRMQPADVSRILRGMRKPSFAIVERMAGAIGVTWGELFNEPQILLSPADAAVLRDGVAALRDGLPPLGECLPVLARIVENDASQKEIAARPVEPPPSRRRRGRKAAQPSRLPGKTEIRDSAPIHHEVELIPNAPIPQWGVRVGVRRVYRVLTDSMIGAGILEGSEIYVRTTRNEDAADGKIIVCTLNRSTYLKRLDLRGGGRSLESANPRYSAITVADGETFVMIGIVEMPPAEE